MQSDASSCSPLVWSFQGACWGSWTGHKGAASRLSPRLSRAARDETRGGGLSSTALQLLLSTHDPDGRPPRARRLTPRRRRCWRRGTAGRRSAWSAWSSSPRSRRSRSRRSCPRSARTWTAGRGSRPRSPRPSRPASSAWWPAGCGRTAAARGSRCWPRSRSSPAGLLLAGLAPGIELFVAARFLQGLGVGCDDGRAVRRGRPHLRAGRPPADLRRVRRRLGDPVDDRADDGRRGRRDRRLALGLPRRRGPGRRRHRDAAARPA